MSEENQNDNGGQESAPKVVSHDDLKNTKAEFNRKIDNLTAIQQELISAINGMTLKNNGSVPEEDVPIDDLIISDPKKAVHKMKSEAKAEILGEIEAQNKLQQEQNQVLTNILNDFPELGDPNHELTKRTLEIYAGMSKKDKASPLSYKVAARDAADELNIVPKRRRTTTSDNDNFALQGKSNGGKERANKIDSATLAFAARMGLDINDKEVLNRLTEHSKRNFLKWS